jgi:hypothetical protein
MTESLKIVLTALILFYMVKGIIINLGVILNGVVDTTPPPKTEVQCEKD